MPGQPPSSDPAGLALALAREGLIQFGHFAQPDGLIWPVALHLGWLPSYPALLRQVAAALDPLATATGADRVLTTPGAVALGVSLALVAERPVLYPSGALRDDTAAFAIEGAYDVGHPTALLSDQLVDLAQADTIRALSSRVGLEIHSVVAVIDLGLGAREALEAGGFRVASVLALRDTLPTLETHRLLSAQMRAVVEAWLGGQRFAEKQGTPHP